MFSRRVGEDIEASLSPMPTSQMKVDELNSTGGGVASGRPQGSIPLKYLMPLCGTVNDEIGGAISGE